MDAGIFGIVGIVTAAFDPSDTEAEDVLKGAKSLGARLVTVADEQGAFRLSGIGNAFEQIDGNEDLAHAGTHYDATGRRYHATTEHPR